MPAYSVVFSLLKQLWTYRWQAISLFLGIWLWIAISFIGSEYPETYPGMKLKPPKIIENVIREEVPVIVEKLVFTDKQLDKIEAKIGGELPKGMIVGIVEVPSSGSVVGSIEGTRTEFTFFPSPPRKYEFLNDLRVGISIIKNENGEYFNPNITYDMFRLKKFILGFEAGNNSLFGNYISVEMSIKI